jgi:hypothetical protein
MHPYVFNLYIYFMNKINIACFIVLALIVGFSSCKKTDAPAPTPPPPDPCASLTINTVATKTYTVTGQNLAAVTVTSPVGQEYTYSVTALGTTGTAVFQPSPIFFNIGVGTFVVTTKNTKGCSDTAQVTVVGYGAKYYAVKTLVQNYCGPCHLNGTVSGGKNFDDDNSIVASWDRIRIRTVNGTPSFMPQNSQLTAVDKQKITDWVNAGHRTTD